MAIKEKAKETKATAKHVEKVVKEVTTKFSKQQLLKSKKYSNRRDALNALLKDDKQYTLDQVDRLLEDFYKGGTK